MTEVRLGLFLSAGAVIVLASVTRFEGVLLLIPLIGWSVVRWRALRQGRAGSAVGVLVCLGALPAVAAAGLLVLGVQGHGAAELIRFQPLVWVGGWLQTLTASWWGHRLRPRAADAARVDHLGPHVGNLLLPPWPRV